jgi:hypothetical protein
MSSPLMIDRGVAQLLVPKLDKMQLAPGGMGSFLALSFPYAYPQISYLARKATKPMRWPQ